MSSVYTPEQIQAFAQGHLAAAQGSPQNGGPTAPPVPAAVASNIMHTPPAPQAPAPPPKPEGAPLTPADKDNARAQALEARLRQQQEAEDNATIYGPTVTPGAPQAVMPDGTVENADRLAGEAKAAQQKETQLAQKATDDTTTAAATGIKAAEGEAKARAPADALLAQRMEDGYAHVRQVEDDVAKQSQEALANYKAVNDEMHKLAVSQPTDLFGQAGVNKTLGSVAIFLGGAGMNGAGPNKALQQFEGMADRAVQAQKTRFEMLSRVGEGDRTLFGMLQQRLGNTMAAENTLKSMALESQKAMVQQAANQFAGPKARANAQQFVAQAEAQQAQLMQRSNNAYLNHATQAVQLAAQHQTNSVAADAEFLKDARAHQSGSIAGFVGWIPNKSEHAALAKTVGGARTMVAMTNDLEALSNAPGSLDQKAAAARKFLVANSAQFLGARNLLETGTRLEEGEMKMIAQLVPDLTEASLKNMTGRDIMQMTAKMQQIRTVVTAIAANKVLSAAPRTMAFDSQDPLWGQYNPRTYRDPLVSAGQRAMPNSSMTSELAKMATYPTAHLGLF